MSPVAVIFPTVSTAVETGALSYLILIPALHSQMHRLTSLTKESAIALSLPEGLFFGLSRDFLERTRFQGRLNMYVY